MYKIVSLLESISNTLQDLRNHILFSPKAEENRTDHVATIVADSASELQRVLKNVADNQIPPIALGEYYVVKVFKRNF